MIKQIEESKWILLMQLLHCITIMLKVTKLHQEIQPKHRVSSAGWFRKIFEETEWYMPQFGLITVFVFSARSKQGYEQMFWEGPQYEGGSGDLNFAFPKYETGADFWNFHLPRLILGGGFGVKFHIPTQANQSISTWALYRKFETKRSQNYQFGSAKWF